MFAMKLMLSLFHHFMKENWFAIEDSWILKALIYVIFQQAYITLCLTMIIVCLCFHAVYLFIGLVFMMLTLANVYDIPELNIGYHFYMRSDDEEEAGPGSAERSRLRNVEGNDQPPKYGAEQVNQAYQGEGKGDSERKQLTGSINDWKENRIVQK